MTSLKRSVQSIGALTTFEAAARLGGFTLAAHELGVSQAAVSRQIKLLETDLNTPLFLRAHRRVSLTPAGEALAGALTSAFGRVADVIETIRQPGLPGTVTLGATLAFSHFWLLPRLAGFRALHPGVRLRLIAEDSASDLRRDRLDIAIRYGAGRFEGARSLASLRDEVFPVCGPALHAAYGLDGSVERLVSAPLLASDWLDPSWLNWRQWARLAGLGPALGRASDRSTLRFNHYTDTIQAAISGEGIALGWARLLSGPLGEGKLVRACDTSLWPEERYHLLVPTDRDPSAAATKVLNWLSAAFADLNS